MAGVERHGKLNSVARKTHALKAAVVHGVRVPSSHAGHVELAILGMESTTLNTGAEVADQRDDRPLRLAVHFIAQHQGTVTFESTPAKTYFSILLPVKGRDE